MKIKFYHIENKVLDNIIEYTLRYNEINKKIFNDNTSNLDELMRSKNDLEKNIFKILDNQIYLGCISDDQYYSIENEFRKKYLGKNLLNIDEIKQIYNSINNDDKYKKIKYFLGEAIKENKSIYIIVQ